MTATPMTATPKKGHHRGDLFVALLLSVIVLGPALLFPGHALRGDMVFVPDQPWKDTWLGLDGSVPRAVPMDALVSIASQLIGGQALQKLLLLAIFTLAGVGAARLVAHHPPIARLAAIAFYLWNPWVAERLLIGQWAVIGGYAALPWVALAATRLRERPREGWAGLVISLSLAAVCSPSSGLMAGLVALAVVLAKPTRRALAAVIGIGVVANLPWLVPSLLVPGGLQSGESEAFATFAARGESALGLLPSLLSLGGIWKVSVLPAERANELIVALSCLLTVGALWGLRRAWPNDPLLFRGLAGAAAVAFLLAAIPGWPPAAHALDSVATDVPALAILRDSHRYLAPVALLLVPGVAAAVAWVLGLARPGREAYGGAAALLALAPVLLLPSLAFGSGGRIAPVHYPKEWSEVRSLLADVDSGSPARTVVLPWTGSYRGFAWNEHRAMLDPAPRFFPGEVVIDDRVLVGDEVLPSEDPAVAEIDAALRTVNPARRLRDLGVRWVLVEKGMPTGVDVPDGRVVHEGAGLRLVDLGVPAAAEREYRWTWLVVSADLCTVMALFVSIWSRTGQRLYRVKRITYS